MGRKVTPPQETFYSAIAVGVSSLEDVAHWGRLSQDRGGYLTRSHLRDDFAPAVRGVRRAFNPNGTEYGRLDHYGFQPTSSRLLIYDLDRITAPSDLDIGDLDQVALPSKADAGFAPDSVA